MITFFIILFIFASIITIIGILMVKMGFKIFEEIENPIKVKNIKQEAKKRYERKYATKRIPKSSKKV